MKNYFDPATYGNAEGALMFPSNHQPKPEPTTQRPPSNARDISCEFIELINPLAILREILRRINSATGEPTACRLDPDLQEQIEKMIKDERV